MSDSEIQVYLSAALDQEACKATLLAALSSRVDALRGLHIPDTTIIASLHNVADEPYQMNDDVIEDMIEQVMITSSTNVA